MIENFGHDKSLAFESRKIFGLDIAVVTRERALELLETRINKKISVRLAFVNANLANVAYEEKEIHNMLRGFFLLNDGSGINMASKLIYRQSFPDNLNGTDFTPYFLDHCSTHLRVFLLGASPIVITRTAAIFSQRWPQHCLAGYQHGFFSKSDEEDIINTIKVAKPNLILVALGNGLQERWVEKLVPDFTLSAWGVGAFFDFISGEISRAPSWMRMLGVEWIYRLLLEPGRMWRRYLLGNPKFVIRILRELKK